MDGQSDQVGPTGLKPSLCKSFALWKGSWGRGSMNFIVDPLFLLWRQLADRRTRRDVCGHHRSPLSPKSSKMSMPEASRTRLGTGLVCLRVVGDIDARHRETL